MKKALITGITGQDGSYLTELLLSKGYEVHGMIRRSSTYKTSRIGQILSDIQDSGGRLFLHYGDLSDGDQVSNIIHDTEPQEVYNLGAQSHVKVSFDAPTYTGDVTALGASRVLEVMRRSNLPIRLYQASTSELFGLVEPPQSESTPFHPRSPYACAKLYAYWMVRNYREAYGVFACNGILFNHESHRRGETFVTRKITESVARILSKKQSTLTLGNLGAKRDWGFAPEYVEVMWQMLQREKADDFVIGTGETHTVGEFVEEAFSYADLDQERHVEIDKTQLRPLESGYRVADTAKAKRDLGLDLKVGFKDLVRIMVDADMRAEGLEPIGDGDKLLEEKFPNRWWASD
jgi:GDPmannose 4,6-dehydratase